MLIQIYNLTSSSLNFVEKQSKGTVSTSVNRKANDYISVAAVVYSEVMQGEVHRNDHEDSVKHLHHHNCIISL